MSSNISSSNPKIHPLNERIILREQQEKLRRDATDIATLWLEIAIDVPKEIENGTAFHDQQVLRKIPKKFEKMAKHNRSKLLKIDTLYLANMYSIPEILTTFYSLDTLVIEGFKSEGCSIPEIKALKYIFFEDDSFKFLPGSLSKLHSLEAIVHRKPQSLDFVKDLPNLQIVSFEGDIEKLISVEAKNTIQAYEKLVFFDSVRCLCYSLHSKECLPLNPKNVANERK